MSLISPNVYPRWMNTDPFLPQSTTTYRIPQSKFEEEKYHEQRRNEVERSKRTVTLPISSLCSWTNAIDYGTEGAIDAILDELPKKDTWNAKKLHLIAPAIRGRIVYCTTDGIFYGWKGNAMHNFDDKDELYRIMSKGKLVFSSHMHVFDCHRNIFCNSI